MTERMTVQQLHAAQASDKGDRRRVRGTERTTVDGITFASKREAKRFSELRLLERAGQIRDLRCQVPFDLQGGAGPVMTKGGGKVRRYLADFVYFDVALGVEVIEDAKGHDTDVSELKRAIMAANGLPVVLV
ncbi:DUF1064 domain-containing protein [Thalassovita sp.]|uniref:DUF1064 domain-containing protein n=1 Tax=Thalassovita sp. TaxID=1979401 RepID=UPI002AAF9352|nr:DUF1064 domain-containing protein [Thalassovita sp.]